MFITCLKLTAKAFENRLFAKKGKGLYPNHEFLGAYVMLVSGSRVSQYLCFRFLCWKGFLPVGDSEIRICQPLSSEAGNKSSLVQGKLGSVCTYSMFYSAEEHGNF